MNPALAEEQTRHEIEVLERLGLRWSILAAWNEELVRQGADPGHELLHKLEGVRTKIAAGCFSSCEVGCELAEIEGTLVSRDADSITASVDFWLEMLGKAMSGAANSEELLRYPAIRFHYLNCGFLRCHCRSLGE